MSQRVKCFLLKPTQLHRKYLRRYRYSETSQQCGTHYICEAKVLLDEAEYAEDPSTHMADEAERSSYSEWPKCCARCGTVFSDNDPWQVFYLDVWQRSDTGELITLRDAPAGAIWNAHWMLHGKEEAGDGQYLVVKLPNGNDWAIDSRANNCTMPTDDVHQCWVRHGEAPEIHVDKNGQTCAAGAGSILSGNYHGFLHHGWLVEC